MTNKRFGELFEKWARRTTYEYARGGMRFINWMRRRHLDELDDESAKEALKLVREMAAQFKSKGGDLFESDVRLFGRRACAIVDGGGDG